MMREWKKWAAVVVAICTYALVAYASSIKTWSAGETLTASDLNTTLQHIHNTMVGGHGARLINADVSASAAIAHSKLATPALLPKAWATVGTTCSASPCTITVGSGVTSVTRSGAGTYVATLTSARADVAYAIIGSAQQGAGADHCSFGVATTSTINIECVDDAGAATDSAFHFLVMDNDN